MSLAQYILDNAPISNIPDLLNLHHGNPLGFGLVSQLVFIFIIVEVMNCFNFFIRNRGRSEFYPVLYSLLFVSLVSIYYYCFQADLPTVQITGSDVIKPCIGWFCQHSAVGWGWAIISLILLTHVIYCLLCAIMQVAAQFTVEANLLEGKKWKEWKIALGILLMGIMLTAISFFIDPVFSSWSLFVLILFMIGFVIFKIIADSIRCHNFKWGFFIGITFFIGIIAALMLAIECLHGLIFFFSVFLAVFVNAKASKKQPKNITE